MYKVWNETRNTVEDFENLTDALYYAGNEPDGDDVTIEAPPVNGEVATFTREGDLFSITRWLRGIPGKND